MKLGREGSREKEFLTLKKSALRIHNPTSKTRGSLRILARIRSLHSYPNDQWETAGVAAITDFWRRTQMVL